MKFKQHIVITDPEKFLRGDYHSCFGLYDSPVCLPKSWLHVGEIEFDIDPDTSKLIQIVTEEIDEKINKATAVLNVLEQRKSELLAITYQPEEES